jgi:uncharacterized protein YpmB
VKKQLKIGSMIVSILIILSGCTASDMQMLTGNGEAIPTTSTKHAAISAEKVKLYYSNNNIPKHYEVLGRVSANNDNMVGVPHSQKTIADNLRKQAASLGANAIININLGLEQTSGEAIIIK